MIEEHPLPIVQGKNSDGLHFFGPDNFIHIHDLDIASGDDAIGLNADDIQEPQTYNFNGTAYPGVLHGPITNVQIEHLRLHGSLSGVSLLSLKELVDGIAVSDIDYAAPAAGVLLLRYESGHMGTLSTNGVTVDEETTATLPVGFQSADT